MCRSKEFISIVTFKELEHVVGHRQAHVLLKELLGTYRKGVSTRLVGLRSACVGAHAIAECGHDDRLTCFGVSHHCRAEFLGRATHVFD